VHAFTYESAGGRVVFANGAFSRVADELDRLGASRVLLVADRSGKRWADELADHLGPRLAGRIDDVHVHVPLEDAEAARRVARDGSADVVVTIGGGSATGLAKAVALELDVAVVAVPTTYAGSEATPIWGLTAGARKETGRDPRVQPRVVVYDPVLTLSLPATIAAASGMNALAHCIEAMYATGANPITTVLAEEGIRLLWDGLPRVAAQPDDLDARGDVLAAAYLAGSAFGTAGAGIHHKICHVLGGAYDLPHAGTHSAVLPHSLAFVTPAVPEVIERLSRTLGNEPAGRVHDLAVAIGAPLSLRAVGLVESALDEAATLVAGAVGLHPRAASVAEIRSLLADAFDGVRPVAPATAPA
jgi:alcohol dehydrogenase class IV